MIAAVLTVRKKEGNLEAAAEVYKQKAVVDLKSENKSRAIENYEKAIAVSKDKPEEILKLKSEISKVYASDNEVEKAEISAAGENTVKGSLDLLW